MKKKKFLLFILAIIGLVLVIHKKDLRCLIIDQSNQFQKTQSGNISIYISIDTPKDTMQILFDVIEKGIKRNELFWEKELDKAVVIYCHNPTLFKKYGQKGVAAVTRLGTYIVVPSSGIEEEILSHEFCHSELFNHLGRNWWIYYQQLPNWFDEGLALQFNHAGIYSAESLASIKPWSIEELKRIDRPKKFYVKNYDQLLLHYCISKIEINKWLKEHSKEDLFKLIRNFKDGKNFYKTYSGSDI